MEILIAQASDAPVPLPPEVLASPLAGVIRGATEKSRDRRFANARSMLEALESVAQSGVFSRPGWSARPDHVIVAPSGSITDRVSQFQQAPTTSVPVSSGGMPVPAWATPASAAPAWSPSPSGTQQGPSAPFQVPLPNATAPGQPMMMPRGSTLSGSYVAGTTAPATPKGSSGGLIAAIFGVVLLGVAGFGGWALYTYNSALDRSRHARSTPDKQKSTPTKHSDAHADDDADEKPELHAAPKLAHALPTASMKGFSMKGKSAQEILDRMDALHWKFISASELDLGWGIQSVYTYEGADDSTAELKFARASANPGMGFGVPGAKSLRDGEWTLDFFVVSSDGDMLDAPMNELFAK
jgi:hypothetical protein